MDRLTLAINTRGHVRQYDSTLQVSPGCGHLQQADPCIGTSAIKKPLHHLQDITSCSVQSCTEEPLLPLQRDKDPSYGSLGTVLCSSGGAPNVKVVST